MLDHFLPSPLLTQVDRIRVRASPDRAWPVVRNFDANDLAAARTLFALRTLPERVLDAFKGRARPVPAAARIDNFTGAGKGFLVLGESPGREVVVGAIGKFWKANIEFLERPAAEFEAFRTKGYGKLAWSLRVDPDSQGGSWITWELRVTATDEISWRAFRRYWLLIGLFSHFLRRQMLAHFRDTLGGSPSEEALRLPGDNLVPQPKLQETIAITLEAPPERAWPWLVQMGCQRAGWYSLDRLDNGGRPSASRIIPELQHLEVGDVLPWKPSGREGFSVLELDNNKCLLLGSPSLKPQAASAATPPTNSPIKDCWAFVLEPIGENATRLITRVRADYANNFPNRMFSRFLSLAHFIMQRAQLRNLKRLTEAASRAA